MAARGHACHLVLPAGAEGLERITAALALVPDATGVVHLPPSQLRAALERSEPTAVVLRADLDRDRALCALAARDLMRRRGCASRSSSARSHWFPARRALFGVLSAEASDGLPRTAPEPGSLEPWAIRSERGARRCRWRWAAASC